MVANTLCTLMYSNPPNNITQAHGIVVHALTTPMHDMCDRVTNTFYSTHGSWLYLLLLTGRQQNLGMSIMKMTISTEQKGSNVSMTMLPSDKFCRMCMT